VAQLVGTIGKCKKVKSCECLIVMTVNAKQKKEIVLAKQAFYGPRIVNVLFRCLSMMCGKVLKYGSQ
jgi:hypothetical protein